MNTTEFIYQLVKQWCSEHDTCKASEALRQIAIIAGCLPDVPEQLSEQQGVSVIQWLKENHPNVYLWAMGQFCVGHPATVWGMGNTKAKYSKRLQWEVIPRATNVSKQQPELVKPKASAKHVSTLVLW